MYSSCRFVTALEVVGTGVSVEGFQGSAGSVRLPERDLQQADGTARTGRRPGSTKRVDKGQPRASTSEALAASAKASGARAASCRTRPTRASASRASSRAASGHMFRYGKTWWSPPIFMAKLRFRSSMSYRSAEAMSYSGARRTWSSASNRSLLYSYCLRPECIEFQIWNFFPYANRRADYFSATPVSG